MKVQSGSINNSVNVGGAQDKKVDDKSLAKDAKSSSQDVGASAKVNFSEQAQRISKIKELAQPDVDTIREDKVAHFQSLIDKGEYKIDAAGIADRLVDDHLIG